MGPIRMGGSAHHTVVWLAPPQMSDLWGIDCTAEQCVAEGGMGRIGQEVARSEACRLVAALVQSLKKRVVASGLTPQNTEDSVEGRLEQPVLVLDQVLAVVDDPLGGCVGTDTIMAEEVSEELDGPKAPTWPALCPVGFRQLKIPEQLDPEGE